MDKQGPTDEVETTTDDRAHEPDSTLPHTPP
jgi:hypothetical protein